MAQDYEATVGIDFPDGTRAEPGEIVAREEVADWLVEQGLLVPVPVLDEVEAEAEVEAEVEPKTTPDPVAPDPVAPVVET